MRTPAGEYGSDGDAVPISTPTIAGSNWKLYSGPNGDTTVFSFVADSEITDFHGDIKTFFRHLIHHHGLSKSQYLTSVGAGEFSSKVSMLEVVR